MIEVKGLSRYYDELAAVEDACFHIGKGEIVGLLGHNGAGKSTIMKMLTGYLEPSSGEIFIDGKSMRKHSREIRKLIGYLPENCPLYSEMRVMDYLYFQAELKAVDPAVQNERVLAVMHQTQLQERATSYIGTLSRGLRQRVGVAQALLANPKILILDEPTNGLDPTQIELMRSLIKSAAESATVVISTHILQQVEAVCDRVLIMRNGKLVVDQPLDKLQDASRLLVVVDKPGEAVQRLLADIAPVEMIEAGGYQLDCSKTDVRETAARVSKALADQDVAILELRPVTRSLVTLFREVQETGVQPNA